MTTPTHNDIQRDIGGLQANGVAMEKRLDRIEKAIEDGFKELRNDIADLKQRESSRSALEKAAVWLSGVIGAAAALIVEHIWK